MSGWAATNTLREALAVAWPEGDHAEPNVFTEALAALALVEAALDAAEPLARHFDSGFACGSLRPEMEALAAALRAVREGK